MVGQKIVKLIELLVVFNVNVAPDQSLGQIIPFFPDFFDLP